MYRMCVVFLKLYFQCGDSWVVSVAQKVTKAES